MHLQKKTEFKKENMDPRTALTGADVTADLTSTMKPGVPPREMMKELSTDSAMKYGKIRSQLSLPGHRPGVAVRLPGCPANARHLQLSNT